MEISTTMSVLDIFCQISSNRMGLDLWHDLRCAPKLMRQSITTWTGAFRLVVYLHVYFVQTSSAHVAPRV